MKLATKAAIFSALVFPGAGYFLVKSKLRGAIFCTLTLAWLASIFAIIVREAHGIAQTITQKILSSETLYNANILQLINIILDEIKHQSNALNIEIATGPFWAICILWLIGIIDSFRLGNAFDSSTTIKNIQQS